MALIYLILLYNKIDLGNVLGILNNYDRLFFTHYFIFKILITIFISILELFMFVFFIPNILSDSKNYIIANLI